MGPAARLCMACARAKSGDAVFVNHVWPHRSDVSFMHEYNSVADL